MNPFILATIISAIIILLWPLNIAKYKLIAIESSKCADTDARWFVDIDNNGYSDEISVGRNFIGGKHIHIQTFPEGKLRQWNFFGEFRFSNNNYIVAGDYNNDGTQEIYTFTLISDSVFIHSADVRLPHNARFTYRFVTRIGSLDGYTDAGIIPAKMEDLTGDGFKEVIFGIVSGFGIYPRQVYAYDIVNDTLLQSPRSGSHFFSILQADITNDGKSEFLLSSTSSYNIHIVEYPFHDSSNYYMVLNQQLGFLFPPLTRHDAGQYVVPFVLYPGTAHTVFGYFFNPLGAPGQNATLIKLNTRGRIVKELTLPSSITETAQDFINYEEGKEEWIGILGNNGEINLYDSALAHVKTLNLTSEITPDFDGNILNFIRADADGDQQDEYIFPVWSKDKIYIFRHDFSHPVAISVPLTNHEITNITFKKNGKHLPEIAIYSGQTLSMIKYGKNPLYYTRWLYYLLIYASILLFTLFVRKVQRVQMQRKYDTEKKITELQLKIVRNQLDPHFAFNAINSAIDAVNNQKNEEAGQHLKHFSQLYRSLVLSSDKIKRTLAEEIEFTENYLKMEQFRFNQKFQYIISIDPAIKPAELQVPKMVIQSYAENAIKHGLLCKKDDLGLLEISAKLNSKKLIITIKDNGVGRKNKSPKANESTGKGFETMNHLYELYHKITSQKITCEILDLYHDNGTAAGTKILVNIPV